MVSDGALKPVDPGPLIARKMVFTHGGHTISYQDAVGGWLNTNPYLDHVGDDERRDMAERITSAEAYVLVRMGLMPEPKCGTQLPKRKDIYNLVATLMAKANTKICANRPSDPFLHDDEDLAFWRKVVSKNQELG